MNELPTNLYQLAAFFGVIIAALWGGLQGWKWWLNNQKEISASRALEAVAQRKQDIITASQVAKLMMATDDVKQDIVEIRAASKDQNEMLMKAMDALEANVKDFNEMFTNFLIKRVDQFDQSLLGIKK